MKKIYAFFVALFWASIFYGQQNVSGVVFDHETNEPLAFAIVKNIQSNESAVTNTQGKFAISSTLNKDTLVVTYLGYDDMKLVATENMVFSLRSSTLLTDEIVYTVNRDQKKRTESPVAITSISSQTIAENKPNTIDEVLNQVSGVYMVDLGNEQHTMSIRRPIDYGASYLYLEDGVPIRTSGVFNHNALLEINMANTKKIEIIRGPASSLYGSEAIGGAINFISFLPTHQASARVGIRGGGNGYKRTDFYASNTYRKLGVRLSGYYANQRNGFREHSDFDKLGLSLNAHYQISDKSEIIWTHSLVDYKADMTGSLDSVGFFDKAYSSEQTFTNRDVWAYRTKLKYEHYWTDFSKTSFTGYFRNNSIQQNPSYRVKDDYKPWSGTGDPNLAHGEVNENSFNSYGAIVQHRHDFKKKEAAIIAGLSMDYSPNQYEASYISINKEDGIYTSFTETDSMLALYDADLLNLAGYIQGSISPVKKLHLIGAVRFDYFNYIFDNHLDSNAYTAVLDGKNVFDRLTPKVGMTYELSKNNGVYANYSQGFVPPQVSELYRGQKVPTILPVYYDNYEFGGWVKFLKNKAKIDFSFYKTDGRNEIISVLNDDGSTTRQNAGKTTHQGIEYTLNLLPHRDVAFRFSGTNAMHNFVQYVESGVDYSDERMPRAPEFIFNTQISYKPKFIKGLRMSLEWQHLDKYYLDASNTKEYSGYDLFNLRVGYKIKNIEIWSFVKNITNKNYATVASASQWGESFTPGAPRNIQIGIAYNFSKKKGNE